MTASSGGRPALGRYSSDDETTGPLYTVHLVGLPIALFLRARDHHDELVREFTLMAIAENAGGAGTMAWPIRLRALVHIFGRQYGAAAPRADAQRDEAIERGDPTADLSYAVPSHIAADVTALNALIDEADGFCNSGDLLTLPRDEATRAFGAWYNGEFKRQIDGLAPTPWSGPLQ